MISTLSTILPKVLTLKISREKAELERTVLEHWNIDITEFPIHDDLKTDDPDGISEIGDVTSNDELQRNDADAPSDDLEREDDISESEEAIENNEIQRNH